MTSEAAYRKWLREGSKDTMNTTLDRTETAPACPQGQDSTPGPHSISRDELVAKIASWCDSPARSVRVSSGYLTITLQPPHIYHGKQDIVYIGETDNQSASPLRIVLYPDTIVTAMTDANGYAVRMPELPGWACFVYFH